MPRVLELALVLSIKEFSMRVENRQSWNALLERHMILLGQILVLIKSADVDVNDDVVLLDE